ADVSSIAKLLDDLLFAVVAPKLLTPDAASFLRHERIAPIIRYVAASEVTFKLFDLSPMLCLHFCYVKITFAEGGDENIMQLKPKLHSCFFRNRPAPQRGADGYEKFCNKIG